RLVGGTREKYKVDPPATAGNERWERYNRFLVNTAEQLVLFIPAIYAFAHYVSPTWATRLGAVFLIGRILYFLGYRRAPEKRMPGAVMSSFTSYIMILGSLIGLVMQSI
ncbi:MAG: MAPEG family protein, partial [Myxococcales bacterium]|nr:MAPEG family protein [Myxococcales bacterium]